MIDAPDPQVAEELTALRQVLDCANALLTLAELYAPAVGCGLVAKMLRARINKAKKARGR